MKPEIPNAPIESEPFPDPAWREARRVYPYTDAVRAQHLRDDRQILLDELAAAGVELGEYERGMATWLANWEYGTIVAIASWIKRAHAAGAQASGSTAAAATEEPS